MKYHVLFFILIFSILGCSGESKSVQKIAKPVDQAAAELVKIREMKTDDGETRAVVSPADEKKLKLTF